jgi:hypothetical protein
MHVVGMDALLKIADGSEVFVEAVPLEHPDLPGMVSAIRLRFAHTTLFVSVNPEYDTVQLSREAPPDLDSATPATPDRRFVGAVSKPIQWAWTLTNHQGYRDGLQIEFCDPESASEAAVVQFVGKASMLEISVVTPGNSRLPTEG